MILTCTVTVLWVYSIINVMLILLTIKNVTGKEVAVQTSCFISEPLSYNICWRGCLCSMER